MESIIKAIEADYVKEDMPRICIGDTIQVHFLIVEGRTERIQIYEGVVIASQNKGIGRSITVRKMSSGVGVERIFPLHSPRIQKIVIISHAKIRRAKLYYLRQRRGKSARLKTLIKKKKA